MSFFGGIADAFGFGGNQGAPASGGFSMGAPVSGPAPSMSMGAPVVSGPDLLGYTSGSNWGFSPGDRPSMPSQQMPSMTPDFNIPATYTMALPTGGPGMGYSGNTLEGMQPETAAMLQDLAQKQAHDIYVTSGVQGRSSTANHPTGQAVDVSMPFTLGGADSPEARQRLALNAVGSGATGVGTYSGHPSAGPTSIAESMHLDTNYGPSLRTWNRHPSDAAYPDWMAPVTEMAGTVPETNTRYAGYTPSIAAQGAPEPEAAPSATSWLGDAMRSTSEKLGGAMETAKSTVEEAAAATNEKMQEAAKAQNFASLFGLNLSDLLDLKFSAPTGPQVTPSDFGYGPDDGRNAQPAAVEDDPLWPRRPRWLSEMYGSSNDIYPV